MRWCRNCVLPLDFPHVTFDATGLCSLCRDYEKTVKDREARKREFAERFKSLVKEKAGRGPYDVLMCYSGGKDSSYALTLFKETYGLKVLAFTLDNGFLPPETFTNIRNVVEKLGVDHVFHKMNFGALKGIFRASLERNLYSPKSMERASAVCVSCIGFVKYLAFQMAIEKGIPFIGYGWTPGQAPVTSSVLRLEPAMLKQMAGALQGPMREVAGKAVDPYFLSERHFAEPERFPYLIHPAAFADYDEERVFKTIEKLGWRRPKGLDANSTNCMLNSLAVENHKARYGFNPYAFELAGLVRQGYLKREEGLRRVDAKVNPATVALVKKRLGVKA